MALETGTYISDLVITNPTAADPKAQGDDHLRLVKATVKATFPNLSGAVTATHTELNYVDGVTSAIQAQIDAKGAHAGQSYTGTHDFTGATLTAPLKANLASPTFTGNPTAPTKSPFDTSTALATTAYVDAATTAMVVSVGATSLTHNNYDGHQNFARATVASHATTADIWGAYGNQIDWTGTATTTIFPNAAQAGSERVLICAGACSFTAGANMLIDGVASGNTVVCAANDHVRVMAVSTTQFKLTRFRYDGLPQVVQRGFAYYSASI